MQIVHCSSFSSTNIEALINQKDIVKINISEPVEFGYTLWLLLNLQFRKTNNLRIKKKKDNDHIPGKWSKIKKN